MNLGEEMFHVRNEYFSLRNDMEQTKDVSEQAQQFYTLYLGYKKRALEETPPHLYFQIADFGNFLFPFGLRSIYHYIFHVKEKQEKSQMLNRLEEIEKKFLENDEAWKKQYAELLFYIGFENTYCVNKTDLQMDILIDWSNFNAKYRDIKFELSLLWKYVNKNELKAMKELRQYYCSSRSVLALDILLSYGDMEALKLFLEVTKRIYTFAGAVPQSTEANIYSFLERIGYEEERRKFLFSAGHRWENICYEIAKCQFNVEIVKHPRLPNGKIPDMMPNLQGITYNNKEIQSAPLIIECKKSLYFTENIVTGEMELTANPTVKQYKPYCEELQLWILHKNEYGPDYDINDAINKEKIKYIFAEDFLHTDLPTKLKNKIKRLLNEANKKFTFSKEWTESYKEAFILIEQIEEMMEQLKLK